MFSVFSSSTLHGVFTLEQMLFSSASCYTSTCFVGFLKLSGFLGVGSGCEDMCDLQRLCMSYTMFCNQLKQQLDVA